VKPLRVTVRIQPGQDRYNKSVACLVEFHASDETRAFLFSVPGDGYRVVSGWKVEDLLTREADAD
jgi:hypothetical protein